MSREVGTVKFFSEEKGYGFIVPEAGGKDIFVHRGDLVAVENSDDGKPTLAEGQRVNYTITISDRKKGDGRKASDVRIED